MLHGDWFAGKGLGVVTLDFQGLNIHVRSGFFSAALNFFS